jgi:hypothetical protein
MSSDSHPNWNKNDQSNSDQSRLSISTDKSTHHFNSTCTIMMAFATKQNDEWVPRWGTTKVIVPYPCSMFKDVSLHIRDD